MLLPYLDDPSILGTLLHLGDSHSLMATSDPHASSFASMGPHQFMGADASAEANDVENLASGNYASSGVKAGKQIKQMMALGEKFGPDNRAELDEENERQIGQSAAAEKATANKDFMKMAKDETEADNSRDVTPDQAELENKVRAAMLNTPPKMGTLRAFSTK
eukprot:GEMP01063056.1.p1 GENE.GEMP01063056.1~~GEMP01063056.1.p1  ORF type:complete len:163 (+),score=42.44 GEMP01063056.1:183-671(+)